MTEEPEEKTEDSTENSPEFGYVYLLGSDGPGGVRSYVGWTIDLDKRLSAHNTGKGARSTRGRVWRLLYAEQYTTRTEAQSREWHLKKDRAFRRTVLLSLRSV
ncbi:MAG: GIY-YIG nuclease family protein [Proteobacteria bacterium]|nr:GIY-YIG nuclease family protein [Pseudomonadota bacterium]